MSVPITNGVGNSSVAAEVIATQQYQQIKVVGGETGSTSVLGVNPDRSINVSVLGTVNVTPSGEGSIIAVLNSSSIIAIVTGSVVAIPTGNQSVSGSVGASILGQLPAGTAPLGSVATLQGTNPWVIVGSVYGAGSVAAFQAGTQITSIVSAIPSSVLVGASIFGQLPAGTAVLGSIATLQGTTPWINTNVGSVITVSVGSTIAVLQSPSIVGTYVEDAAAASGDRGVFILGVRNDTLSSITSADGDYSAQTVGPVGEVITANAPLNKWIRGTADLRVVQGASVLVVAAQGASVFTYITGVQVVNFGPSSVIVTIAGGLGSILGYTIAPAGGGSNIVYPNALRTGENSAVTASISSAPASVLVSAQGFSAKI